MNLTIAKKTLVRAIENVARAVPKKSAMPILSNLVITAENNRITLAGTDLSISLGASVSAAVKKPGKLCVSAANLRDIVKSLPDGEVTLSATQTRLSVAAGKAKFGLPTMPSDDFPTLPVCPAEGGVVMSAEILAKLCARASYAMSHDETRAHLSALLFELRSDGKQRTVATDGHRLALAELPCSEGFTALVPDRAAQELRAMCESAAGGDVTVTVAGERLFASVDGCEISLTTTGREQFPPYTKVVPSSWTKTVTVQRVAFLDAVRRVSIVSSDKSGGIRLVVEPGSVEVVGENPDKGEGSESVDSDYSGEALAIGCNARYLVEALSAISHDSVDLCMSSGLDPIRITGHDDDSAIATVMPMRI